MYWMNTPWNPMEVELPRSSTKTGLLGILRISQNE